MTSEGHGAKQSPEFVFISSCMTDWQSWTLQSLSHSNESSCHPATGPQPGSLIRAASKWILWTMYIVKSESCSVVLDSLLPHGLYSPWNSTGQNTGVGSRFPFPGDLPNPEIQSMSPALQVDSLPADHQGSPRILEWGAYPFSSRSSWPRNWTWVSCIVGGFFTSWTTRESPCTSY